MARAVQRRMHRVFVAKVDRARGACRLDAPAERFHACRDALGGVAEAKDQQMRHVQCCAAGRGRKST